MSRLEYSLGRTCGLTFAGIKTGSLVKIRAGDAERLGYYINCFKKRNIYFKILKRDQNFLLLFVYDKQRLEQRLKSAEIKKFLSGFGYAYDDVRSAICTLQLRLAGDEFPHEIGVFLDYDLGDVQRFIQSPFEGVLLNGYWKVYGDVENKARLFERYAKCTDNICGKLLSDKPLVEIFNVG